MLFHLPNFPPVIGESVESQNGGWRRARTRLEAEGWQVTLDSLDQADALAEEARQSSGHGITYIGELRRLDGTDFRAADACDLLAPLGKFLSFAGGSSVAPVLEVGFDTLGNRVYERWDAPTISPSRTRLAWCSTHRPESLATLFPLFLSRWRDPEWNEPLDLALYWYLQANDFRSIETSLLVAQTALELLGWVAVVERGGMLSAEGFDRLPMSDKLRLLLRQADVALPIPEALFELTAFAKGQKWLDGPQALAEVRNSLVHPKLRNRRLVVDAPVRARIEVAQLALSYLELSLLHLLGYTGEFVDRLDARYVGEVKDVPWVGRRSE